MNDVLGILHQVVDTAHRFQVQLDKFDHTIHRNEFPEAKQILSQLEQLLIYLFNPSNTHNAGYIDNNGKWEHECSSDELTDVIEEFITTSDDSDPPGVCLFIFSEMYNRRALQFQEKLLNHTLSQFKSAFTSSKICINDLRELTLIGNSNYQNKFIVGMEKLLTTQLSIIETKSLNIFNVNYIKSKDLEKCKVKQFLDVIDILTQLNLEFSKKPIYYAFQIICKNLISEFDYLEAKNIIDMEFPKNLHFDPKVEFGKIANEEMSFHYITIASQFFESQQGFSVPVVFSDELSSFSKFISNLIFGCEGLLDQELKMRVQMIMACICAYSASFGKLISEHKEDINKLLHIFTNFTLIKYEITKMLTKIELRPIFVPLDFSQCIAELALKAILRKINNEMELDTNKGYIIGEDIMIRLSRYPKLPVRKEIDELGIQ